MMKDNLKNKKGEPYQIMRLITWEIKYLKKKQRNIIKHILCS